MVCDGQRVAVPPVAELELAFEVGAPQVIGHGALGQRRAARAVARPAATLDQAVAIENRMDGALGRYSDIAAEPPDQELAIYVRPSAASRPSVGQSGSQPAAAAGWRSAPDGVTDRSGPKARAPCSDRISCSQSYAITQNPGRRPSWLPRPTGGRQSEGALPSPNSLSTASTPPACKGEKCYPCVRYEMSPMSRAALGLHRHLREVLRNPG